MTSDPANPISSIVSTHKVSGEKSLFENSDRATREIEKLLEDSNNRPSLNGLDLGESYINGKSCLAIEYSCAGGDAPNSRYVVFIEACRPSHFEQAGFGKIDYHVEISPGDSRGNRDHSFMRVHVSEGVEGPKKVIPSTVWFEPANQGPGVFSEYLFYSLNTLLFKSLLIGVTGKFALPAELPFFTARAPVR
jgi:hypothetical protein